MPSAIACAKIRNHGQADKYLNTAVNWTHGVPCWNDQKQHCAKEVDC